MPFTLAHPVAILPFARQWPRLPLSALAIGSMAPDFPYFLLINSEYYHFGHSFPGVFEFCLPAGIVALLIFHVVVKFPLLSLLPSRQVERLLPVAKSFRLRTFLDFALTVLALTIGAISHIVVDSFTHYNGWSVRHLHFLASPLPIYKALQYGGSVGGLWYLYYLYTKWFATAPSDPDSARTLQRLISPRNVCVFLGLLLALSACAGFAFSACVYRSWGGAESAKKIFADALESGMSACGLGLFIFSCVWNAALMRRRSANG